MTMFGKDKEYGRRLDLQYREQEPFILWGVEPGGTVKTKIGDAQRTNLKTSALDRGRPGGVIECSTLASAVAEKAKDADPSEFPAIVCWERVPGRFNAEALVLSWLRDPTPAEVGEVNPGSTPSGNETGDGAPAA